MDQATRNQLQRATQDARRLLESEFAAQLEGTFDILPDGTVLPEPGAHLDDRQQLVRHKIVEAIEHIRLKEAGKTTALAVDDYLREAAFTFLNRFAALKMLEARGLVQQCVMKGDLSSGFKEFVGLAPGLGGLSDKGYQLYLECLFDELGTEVKVLFDRRDPGSLLWPRRQALLDLFTILNRDDLRTVWGEDETIGWVYQYFNSQEERRAMRDASQAPRNSRELAVRNQFFTPRYVVQFLTDNTLGRIWYEMRHGETRLVETCQYLVRRPTEIFLEAGQSAPPQETANDLSQAELLQQPVHIPHRPKKDPRELKVLDPACGSGHFLLYCFELLLAIYEEAWHDEHSPPAKELVGWDGVSPSRTLRQDYPTLEALHAAMPELILRHNLHGIDIDGRCVQIAALALWMRAQRAWQAFGLAAANRPQVNVSRIVCAEPMPGEESLLQEFLDGSLASTPEDRMLGQFVRRVFEAMKLAGEAGSLLKIENEIAGAVAEAKEKWLARPRLKQRSLFSDEPKLVQRELDLEVARITDANFWDEAEDRIYTALRNYSEQAELEGGYQRRLFADDAARGFAFIDLCRQRNDVTLMNPPFGPFTDAILGYAQTAYPTASNDIYAAFVLRALQRCNDGGCVGVLASRLGFYLEGLQEWREKLMCNEATTRLFADLGYGVLDAVVETAAYVVDLNLRDDSLLAISALAVTEKKSLLDDALSAICDGRPSPCTFLSRHTALRTLPGSVLAYWLPRGFLSRMVRLPKLRDQGVEVFSGLQTDDDVRFLRLWWECPAREVNDTWLPFAKGGEYQPFANDLHLVVRWAHDGAEMKDFVASLYQNWSRHIKNPDRFGLPGLTYTERTTSDISVRAFPSDAVFSVSGPVIQTESTELLFTAWALLTSRIGRGLIEMGVGSGDSSRSGTAARHYRTGILKELFWPQLTPDGLTRLRDCLSILFRSNLASRTIDETHRLHSVTRWGAFETLAEIALCRWKDEVDGFEQSSHASHSIDTVISDAFGLTEKETESLSGPHPGSNIGQPMDSTASLIDQLLALSEEELVAKALSEGVHARTATKKSYYYSRCLEVIAVITQLALPALVAVLRNTQIPLVGLKKMTAEDLASVLVGCAFGRWDIRSLTGKMVAQVVCDPFMSLPACSPGMLQNVDGAASRYDEVPGTYPIQLARDGILVDDENHPQDIEGIVRNVMETIWSKRVEVIEHEACEILALSSLRDYFRKPALFFADHLRRYSKSRRQAPIYWPLSSSTGGYTIWFYYHRFRRDTLSLALGDFAKPKLRHEQKQLDDLRAEAGPQPTRSQREEIEAQESLVSELSAFVEELARVAPLWNPDLNDGVIINSAPLWRMIGHTPWRKNVKECWDTLCAGDFDWAHLAMHLWPERCVPKCADDRSLAIAHGLDNLLWVEDHGKWRKLLKPADEILDQKQRRQLPVYDRLRETLQQLVAAPQGPTSAETLWQRLESGKLDESSLALILWPRRVIRLCINDRALAKIHGVQVPSRLTEKSTEQLIKRYESAGLSQSVSMVGAVFQRATPWTNVWHELEQGACDQQPVALWLWPDRVIEKCLADRELCAQHELTRFFWYNDPVTGWRRRVAPAQEVTAEVTRRHNPTVKAALDSLLTAPPLTGAGGGRRGSRTATAQRVTRATVSDAAPDDGTFTRSRPRTLAPTTDIETLEMVKNVIAAVPNGASKTDVLTATGLSEARWTAAINTLLQQGAVTKTGERRGTRYQLAQGVQQ